MGTYAWTVWFVGGPTDRWHQWAMRDDENEADGLCLDLIEKKGVYDVVYTHAGWHPDDYA